MHHDNSSSNDSGGIGTRLIVALAQLPPQALVSEGALAEALSVTKRTIRRMVRRGELPPPIAFAGRSTWMVCRILKHFEARATRAEQEAEREARRLHALQMVRPSEQKISVKIQEGSTSRAVEETR